MRPASVQKLRFWRIFGDCRISRFFPGMTPFLVGGLRIWRIGMRVKGIRCAGQMRNSAL